MTPKVRHFVYKKFLNHRILIPLKDFIFYKKKSLRLIMYFWNRNTHTVPLFKDSNIMKFPERIVLENCVFMKTMCNWLCKSVD